jgi:DNA helicase II / ATP-dependent DNA helicase PcrA
LVGVFDGLNEAQVCAVAAGDGHVLVVAGPGTGKTLTIVRRIGHLVEGGIPPEQILALTFSNRAAREMKERVGAFLGDSAAHLFVGTFHLFGLRLLRQSGLEPRRICTRDRQIELIQSITGKGSRWARQAAETISRIKNGVADVADEDTGDLFRSYEAALTERGEWDFDDLIRLPRQLLDRREIPDGLVRHSHIVIDEYQDVSPVQYDLLRSLSLAATANVWAVGDPDQAIYAFRGADIANFRNFQRDFAPVKLIVLKENYRSTKTVVHASNAVIANNRERIDKDPVAAGEQGGPIRIISLPDERNEADLIVREIESRMGGTSHDRIAADQNPRDYAENSHCFSDFAILLRTNAQAAVVREALESWGIPVQIIGRKNPAPIEAFVERLGVIAEDQSDREEIVALTALLCQELCLDEADRLIFERMAFAHRDEPQHTAALGMIDELLLSAEPDTYDEKADKVALMTMHAAKGLEFRIVFVAGCSDGLVPYVKADEAHEIEEERRLFYVSMTRTKEELVILCPRRHFLYGQRLERKESPFLSEIPKELARFVTVADPPKKPRKGKQQSLF